MDESAAGPDVSDDVLAELRAICLGLPETYEEAAWVGRRWLVRKRNFCHVFHADDTGPPTMQRIAEALGPVTMIVFRSCGPELDALRSSGPPFFYAGWGRDVIAMAITQDTSWEEVDELLTESYCMLAPKKLQALVDRPEP